MEKKSISIKLLFLAIVVVVGCLVAKNATAFADEESARNAEALNSIELEWDAAE